MAAPGGTARYGIRTTPIALSAACLAVVAATAACGPSPSLPGAGDQQEITKLPAVPAAPSSSAGLSPGMTPAPVPRVPPSPVGPGPDECLPQSEADAVANGMLECQYFTSGSMMPASVPRGPGMSSGDYAVRFGIVGGRPLMTARIPCASYAVRISIVGETITPDPGTLESILGTCNFPWDRERARMEQFLQAPLQIARRERGIVLHNSEWGVSLFRTPYEAA